MMARICFTFFTNLLLILEEPFKNGFLNSLIDDEFTFWP